MSENNGYLRFQTNTPEEFVPAWNGSGMLVDHVEGQYGPQARYRLADGRLAYLPLHVGEQIAALNLQRGDPLQVCKREVREGLRRKVQWEVKRVNPAAAPSEGVEPSNGAAAVQSTTGTRPAANGHNQPNGSTAIPYRTKVNYAEATRRCLIVAIEAAHAAEKHGAEIGRPLQFSSADIQGVASTLFIQASRDGWIDYAGGAQ